MPDRPPDHPASPDTFSRARAIFEAALGTPPADLEAVLREACGSDAALRATVERMLRADGTPHALLDGGVVFQPDRWSAGDTFAHFEIVGLIGRGGMGEVYRARDVSLNRDVALKVVSAGTATPGTEQRIARLRQEAQTLAALNHPNIASIHGLVEADGVRALVLEFVDGETLADRLQGGPITLEDALACARQIAVALEAAHEQGIVHRDLKPSNVKLRPDGTVKLLDFGLATAVRPAPASADGGKSPTPGGAAPAPHDGLLGTAAYMSPEQTRGREADRRSDIWAFGATLFEMLSGERAFKGRDVLETLAAVLGGEIDWSRLPAATPEPLRRLLKRCLDRDASRRLRDIGEARIVLDDLIGGTPQTLAPEPVRAVEQPRWMRVAVPAAAALVAAGAIAIALWPRATPASPSVIRFVLSAPADRQLLVDSQSRDLSITRDGTSIVYKGGARIDRTQLFVHRLDRLEPEPLTTAGLPKSPFVSPDGQWVGFFEPGQPGAAFKKVPITGGPPVLVSRLDGPSRGATWIDDQTIVAASGATATGLLKLSPSGGDPVVLTRPDRERGESDHLWPQALPGGRQVLFTITSLTSGLDGAAIGVLDLASGSRRPVLQHATQAQFVSSGHLVYVSGGALWAVGFDPVRAEPHGAARVVVPEIVTLPTGAAEFDIAGDGTLVYLAGGGGTTTPRMLVWVDRSGRVVEPLEAPLRPYVNVRLSPDGRRVATEIEGDGHDIWVWDLLRKSLARITFDPGVDQSPVWTADGRRLVFKTETGGVLGSLAMQAADGSGAVERITDGAGIERASYALPDGTGILFSDGTGPSLLKLNGDRRGSRLLELPQGGGDAVLSPDGRRMAYVAIDSGTPQVFVCPFPDVTASRTLVTPAGGSQPRWRSDGRELFYTGLDGALMSVDIALTSEIRIGLPIQLVAGTYYGGISGLSRTGTYDVRPGGQHFLMIKEADNANMARGAQIVVVRNWIEELNRVVPVRR